MSEQTLPAALLARYEKTTAATVHEAMGRKGALDSAIKPLQNGMRVLGRAVTCSCHPGDNLTLHAALKIAGPGDVVVCDAMGAREQGMFGDVLAGGAKSRGLAGFVTDGGVRDRAAIVEIGFPTFAANVCMKGTVKETFGTLNEPVVVGGQLVSPGDLVIGDDDGVCVVPQALLAQTADACVARDDKEDEFRALMRKGVTSWEFLNLNTVMEKKGSAFRL